MFEVLGYGVYVYLFNADEMKVDEDYGNKCNGIILDSILKRNSIHSRIYSGDVLLHTLCEQISEVKKNREYYEHIKDCR